MIDTEPRGSEPSVGRKAGAAAFGSDAFEARLFQAARAFEGMEYNERERLLDALAVYLREQWRDSAAPASDASGAKPKSSKKRTLKAFVRESVPITEIERVLVLAYYQQTVLGIPNFSVDEIRELARSVSLPLPADLNFTFVRSSRRRLIESAQVSGRKRLTGAGKAYVKLMRERNAPTTREDAKGSGERRA